MLEGLAVRGQSVAVREQSVAVREQSVASCMDGHRAVLWVQGLSGLGRLDRRGREARESLSGRKVNLLSANSDEVR